MSAAKPPPSLPPPSAAYLETKRRTISKPPTLMKKLSDTAGDILLSGFLEKKDAGAPAEEEPPTRPSLMNDLSNSMLKLSSNALGVPLEDLQPDSLRDEHETVPSANVPAVTGVSVEASENSPTHPSLRAVINAARFMVALNSQAASKPFVPPPGTEVATLLEQHATEVEKMAEGLKDDPLYKPREHDSLWRLRFLLSAKGDAAKATKDAAACLQWRHENKTDALAEKLRGLPWEEWPGYEKVQQFTPWHVIQPDTSRGTVVFQCIAEQDFEGLVKSGVTDDEYIEYQMHLKEWLFIRRDKTSRRTGTLAKNMVVLDMKGFGSKHVGNSKFKKLMTHERLKRADEMYPQALGAIIIVGLPWAVAALFNGVVKPLAPVKVQEKIRVAAASATGPAKEYVKLGIPVDQVPAFSAFGGEMTEWPPPTDVRRSPP